MVKTITFLAPPAKITDLTATLQAGGSLTVGKTYYYKVIAVNTTGLHWVNVNFSGTSNEVTATTDAVNKQVQLDWTKTANALAYFVLRTEVQGDYSAWGTKFSGASGHYYPTVGDVDTWTDDGSLPPSNFSPSVSACKSTSFFPMNLDPQTNGIGQLKLEGGSSGDPITPKDIYDDAVANGWTNWCNWDGQNFSLMASLWFQDTEVHFLAKKGIFAIIGGYVWLDSAHTDSNIQFGELINGECVGGVNITSIGNYYRPFYIYNNFRMYGGGFTGVKRGGVWDSDDYITFTNYFQSWEDCTLNKIFIENYNRWQHQSPTAVAKNIRVIDGGFDVMNHGKYYMSQIYLSAYLRLDYYDCERMDNFISLITSGYNLYMRDVYPTPNHANMIDFEHPNLRDVDGLPIVYWLGTLPIDGDIDLLQSMKLLVTDKNGNGVDNVKIDIKDKNGDAGLDIQGSDLTNLTTDSDGNLWLDKINITAVSNNTLTDSSKSWVTDEWKGRNVYITETKTTMKVFTNTANVLTFTEDFVVNPNTSTNAGIITEIKRINLKHKVGSGIGVGDAYTTKTWFTPHEITISKDGYETYKGIINFNEAKSLDVKLYRSPFKTRIGRE